MDWDVVDGTTMIPGLLGSYWLAWSSDDFVYRIAVLAWGWVCICSMVYHFNKCDPRLLKYDQRAQWVAQVFMILETPQSSWPILLCGLTPVGWKGRTVLNGVGALWFARHQPVSIVLLLLSYVAYILQFPTGVKWAHSAFHLLLHASGLVVALNPVKKFILPIHADWAWLVWLLGAWLLMPPAALRKGRKAPLFTNVIA
jgi:hypothetical protein